MRVAHVITGLGTGGAEAMLYKLISSTRSQGLNHSVASLTDEGTFGPRLVSDGVAVKCLRMRPGVPTPGALLPLAVFLRGSRPDIVQSWMYHGNLLAGLTAAPLGMPLVWGIHHADVEPRNVKPLTRLTRAVCGRLSHVLADGIVYCADSALRSHARLGYRANFATVIPNGFDLAGFARDPAAAASVRRDIGLPPGARVVGLIARYHPDKDHPTFLDAARRITRAAQDVFFLLAGQGVEWSNPRLASTIDTFAIRTRVRLLGPRSDVPALLSALDVLASSSRSEGFPQILGEAMSCGVLCAATDCGDSREIVGPSGRLVPPRDPAALAQAIVELLSLPPGERAALGAAARERIAARYDISYIARRYTSFWEDVAAAHATQPARHMRRRTPFQASKPAGGRPANCSDASTGSSAPVVGP